MTERKRLVISDADLADDLPPVAPPPAPASLQAPAAPPAGPPLPPLRGATPAAAGPRPGAAPGISAHDPRLVALMAAVIGMVAGWGLGELVAAPRFEDVTSQSGAHAVIGLWAGLVGAAFTAAAATVDRAIAGAWASLLPRLAIGAGAGLVAGFIAGYLADVIYVEMAPDIFELSDGGAKPYLARMIGWAIFGAGVGAVLGLVDKAPKKAVNGALGGAVGGALGGLVFEFVATELSTGVSVSRLLGVLAIGLLIALATHLVEAARREAWIDVVAGGLRGKQFILYHQVTRIGSDANCEIFLPKDQLVAPVHAQVVDAGGVRTLVAADGAPVLVNGTQVAQHRLRGGELISIGTAQLAYSERLVQPA